MSSDILTITKAVVRQLVILVFIAFVIVTIVFCAVIIYPWLFIWRYVVIQTAKRQRPQLAKLVPPLNTGIACDRMYTMPSWNLVGFMLLDGKMDFEKLRDENWKRLIGKAHEEGNGELVYPEFQQFASQFMGYLFWEWDTQFDLNNHVRLYDYEGDLKLPVTLPVTPGSVECDPDRYCTEDDLQRVYGGLLGHPWKEGRSPWEFLYIGNFKSVHSAPTTQTEAVEVEGKCVVAYRIHHSLADGYSIIKFLQDLCNLEVPDRHPGSQRSPKPKLSMGRTILSAAIFPLKCLYDMTSNYVDFNDGPNCWHPFTKKLSRQYNSCISKPFPVELIKTIKNRHDVGYNAVLCAAVTGAFSKLMKDAEQEVPDQFTSFYAFPLPNHPGGLVVHASSISLKLPLASASNSIERLRKIHDGIKKPDNYTGHYMYPAIGIALSFTPVIVSRLLRYFMFNTAVFSCLPGPTEAMDFCGGKMTDAVNTVGGTFDSTAVSMVLMSICGTQRFVAHIDQTVFPSQKLFSKFGQYVEEELNEMLLESLPEPKTSFEILKKSE